MFIVFNFLKALFLEVCSDKRIFFQFLSAILILICGIVANISTPLVLKIIIDNFSQNSTTAIGYLLVGYGIVWIISQASVHSREILMHKAEERTSQILGTRIISHLFMLSPKYHLNQQTGSLTSLIRRSQTSVVLLIWSVFFHAIPVIIEILIVLFILITGYPIKYSLIIIVTIILFAFYSYISTKIALRIRAKANEIDQQTEGTIVDWLLNYETVRIFWKIKEAVESCQKALLERERAESYSLIRLDIIRLGQVFILGVSLCALTYITGEAVVNNKLTVGDFVLFNGYLLQFIGPISVLGYVFRDIEKSILVIKKCTSLLYITPEIQDAKQTKKLVGDSFKIEFQNVSFKYNGRSILKNVSFVIQAGESALIVGETGSGKTTIAKLILRFYDVDEGQILINDLNIKDISLESLHQIIGYMPQEGGLFNTTIEANIRFSNPKADPIAFQKAVKNAALSNFIASLPDGYQTIVGERGIKLSGGEKQRILLARIMLTCPKICIFDEPTSALDEITSLSIMENIQKYFSKSTKITISHQLSVIPKINTIIVLENGMIK